MRYAEKMRKVIPLLGQQISLERAAEIARCNRETLSRWTAAIRQWLLVLDSTGKWEARVKLGVQFVAVTVCYSCQYSGRVLHGGFNLDQTRKFLCPVCGGTLQRSKIEALQLPFNLEVGHDSAETVMRRRGTEEAGLPMRPVTPEWTAGAAPRPRKRAMSVHGLEKRTSSVAADLPVWSKHPVARPDREDRELTDYLNRHIEAAYSENPEPVPVCPWCGTGSHTRFMSFVTARPIYGCSTCGKTFSRLTGTPLSGVRYREQLASFIRLLPQPVNCSQAAAELNVSAQLIRKFWLPKFRRWLLDLDPSGQWERRVLLGSAPQAPSLDCPGCGYHGTMQHYGYASETKSLPIEQRIR
ncbi:DUF746 domain-containing protein [Burkholderia cepacia]|uniref:DUF746 domain-containing protein n=1 Tax=Burkholderia cepacia TaxID=292 RepID=UPI0018C7E150|nr:DUF746 domain-containing protein [Burkholderia cepacia]